MKILIPPSEGKSKENTQSLLFGESEPEYSNEIKEILHVLSTSKNEDLIKIYGTSIEKSEILHKENLELFNRKCSFAYERYTGVVYNNFNFKSLDEESKKFAIKNILVTSGFLGLVKLNDLISRAKNCLEAKIEKPDDELIKVLILKYLSDKQIKINDKLLEFASKRITRSYGKIFEFIYKIDEMSLKKKKSINLKTIKEVLGVLN